MILAVYTALITELSLLRYNAFYTSNWDLGINQQMLWSTGHGRLLYESGDFITTGATSYLEVHSTYLALAVAPLYLALPSATTLFVLQALGAALAIVPLYLIAREALGSRALTFGVIGLYLGSFPVLYALLYDFHWEAFLPVEFLALWYLYTHRRYAAAFGLLLLGTATLEIFPFLAVFVPVVALLGDRPWPAVPALRRWPAALRSGVRRLAASRDGRVGAAFFFACLVAYGLLRLLEWYVLPSLLGGPSGVASVGGVGGGLAGFGRYPVSASTLATSGAYWLLFAAAYAFLPLLRPRFLLLLLPWFVFTTFVAPQFTSGWGFQYPLVALGPLLVALVEGIAVLRARVRAAGGMPLVGASLFAVGGVAAVVLAGVPGSSRFVVGTTGSPSLVYAAFLPVLAVTVLGFWLMARPAASTDATTVGRPRATRLRPRVPVRWVRPVAIGVAVVLLAFNAVMGPLNTSNRTSLPGSWLSYTASPDAKYMGELTSQIPGNANLLASNFLFPYVANDVHAVALPWVANFESEFPRFPYSATDLPTYVLVDSDEYLIVPAFLNGLLWNASVYGLRGEIYSTAYPGSVYLFERGYHGPYVLTNATATPGTVYLGAGSLQVGSLGEVRSAPASRFGSVIVTNPNASFVVANPNLWYGPYAVYPAGEYRLTLLLAAQPLEASVTPSTPVVALDVGPNYLPYLFDQTLTYGEFSPSGWTSFSFNVTLSAAYPMMEFRGYGIGTSAGPNAIVTLDYFEFQPLG